MSASAGDDGGSGRGGTRGRVRITEIDLKKLLRNWQYDLCAAYNWTPEKAGQFGIAEALRLREAKQRVGAHQAAQLVSVAAGAFTGNIEEVVRAQSGGKAHLSVEEEFGPEVAESVEEIRKRQREFVEKHRE